MLEDKLEPWEEELMEPRIIEPAEPTDA